MKYSTIGTAIFTLALSAIAVPASAACYCACVNNKKITVCENTWDTPGGTYCSGSYCTSANELDTKGKLLASLFERVERTGINTVETTSIASLD